jgi:hypothetical protein
MKDGKLVVKVIGANEVIYFAVINTDFLCENYSLIFFEICSDFCAKTISSVCFWTFSSHQIQQQTSSKGQASILIQVL